MNFNGILFTDTALAKQAKSFYPTATYGLSLSTAFFVKLPYTIYDLLGPHHPDAEKPFVIEKTIYISKIDYENFITDLCVDRWFIEQNRRLCHIDENSNWHCILVKRYRSSNGILVMSGGRVFPYWAAYVRDI